MELNEFKFQARRIMLDLAKLMLQTASDESIKKEPKIQHKIVSTALALLVEAETLESVKIQFQRPLRSFPKRNERRLICGRIL